MKTISNYFLMMLLGVLTLMSCTNTKYEGTYAGTMPCADCSGIETEITVNDGKYVVKRTYLGTDNTEQNLFVESGTYKWDSGTNTLTFDDNPEERYLYKNNTLIALDKDGKETTGELAEMYVLKRK